MEGIKNPTEALRSLRYLFAAQVELDRADVKAMLYLGDRLATAQVSALLKPRLTQNRFTLRQAETARAAACTAVLLSQRAAGGGGLKQHAASTARE